MKKKSYLTTVAAAAIAAQFAWTDVALAHGSFDAVPAVSREEAASLVTPVRHRSRHREYCDFDRDEAAGTVAGAVIGGVIGNQIGDGDGGSTLAGVIIGGIIGNRVADDGDDECDSHYVHRTYYSSFERGRVGRRYRWRNPHTDHYGWVTPIEYYSERGRRCVEFEQVIYIDGYRETATGVACRRRGGEWHIVG